MAADGDRHSPAARAAGRGWIVATVVLGLLLVGVVATTYMIGQQARQDRREATLRADIRRDIIDATGVLTRMAARDRANVLTGDDRFIAEREQAYAELVALSLSLQDRITDPLQSSRIARFRTLLRNYHDTILEAPSSQEPSFVEYRRRLANFSGSLEDLLQRLRTRQEALVDEHEQAADRDARLLERILWSAGLICLVLLALLVTMLRLEYRRTRRLADDLGQVAGLQRAMLDSAGYMVFATDPGGIITLFNQAASESLGYAADEVVGKTTPQQFHVPGEVEARAESLTIELQRLVPAGFKTFVAKADQGLRDQRQWTYVRKDGSRFPVELTVDAVRDPRGNIIGYVGIAADLSERVKREQAEQALRKENDRQAALLATVGARALDVICTIDEAGEFTWLTEATSRIWGYRPEEMIGTRFLDYIHPEDRERSARAADSLSETGILDDFSNRYIRKDGRSVDMAWTAAWDEVSGQIVAIARDVTVENRTRAQLVQSEARMRSILQTALDGFISMDAEGIVIDWNLQAETLFGWSREAASGRPLSELIVPPGARQAHARGLAHYLATGEGPILNRRIEVSAMHRDGRQFPIELTVWALQDGEHTVFNAFLRDITERRESQARIDRLNADLTLRAAELEQRNASLDSANKELESFSYSVSHDLRAPLRHLTGYAQMLAEDAGDRLQPEERRYLEQIQASGNRMGTLIDALLKFSRLGRATLRKQPVAMTQLVERTLEELDRSSNPGVQIQVGTLDDAPGDPALLGQVWANLLSNALKYSAPRGDHARVEVSSQRLDDRVVYQVRDNGVGFDMKYADKLFGVFQRLHNQDAFEGTGVGLAITDRIVRRHGGEPTATGEVDKGAQFGFWLPLGAAPD